MRFSERVFEIVKRIPRGRVTTYGAVARKLGTSPRAVGQVLKRNKRPVVVPCHRVVCANGMVGGYCGVPDSRRKIELLKKEDVEVKDSKIDSEKYLWK